MERSIAVEMGSNVVVGTDTKKKNCDLSKSNRVGLERLSDV